ncbi:MAG TPA: ATP-dependent DNA helicase RecG [Solirubrobacteraceae bacterium]|nr:ATP-dependent DNA helicase RecG [Solirubrobacteraceae bacterium]
MPPSTAVLVPVQFAAPVPLQASDLIAAPIRYPAPSHLRKGFRTDGPKQAKSAETLGLHTIGDLLEHLPRDRREARSVAQLGPGETATVVVEVRSIAARPVRRRGMRPRVEATVADASGSTRISFFQQPWLVSKYPVGTRLMLHVRVDERGRISVQGHAPTSEAATGSDAVAHYPATEGFSSTQILALVRRHAGDFDDVLEPLPAAIRTRERLADRPAALKAAHFPEQAGQEETGRRRLAFEELLLAQIALQQRRRRRSRGVAAPRIEAPPELIRRWLEHDLPFPLTGDQQAAVKAIDEDLATGEPMQRLLMGEVGSGKTVVALYAMLRAVEHDMQACLMAPTETLAEQHFATLQTLLGSEPVRAGLLTGSTPAGRRADLLGKLRSGELSMMVGTHALIEEAVQFHRLAVVVVDEQHRFGVAQRSALDAKGARDEAPHVLHMTATPIPRTLALSHYGDLDFTVLRELPRGRRPIRTHVCSTDAERERAYARIKEELDAGRQAFVVCPLVEESETLQAKAATAEFERLRTGPFAGYRLVLLHGQMRPGAKAEAMAAFAGGAADVLVATSVIEVGIDVPNATVMLVEDGDRYGISQLHQLRGRIGRGSHDSVCLLFGRKDSARLTALAAESDGFALAEVDLRLRGEGELVGTRQSGLAQYRFAELPRDAELLERARRWARELMDGDPDLEEPEHALLGLVLRERYGEEALAPIRA